MNMEQQVMKHLVTTFHQLLITSNESLDNACILFQCTESELFETLEYIADMNGFELQEGAGQ